MKSCPNCKRTYTDEALSFCLHDGTPLLNAEAPPTAYNPNVATSVPSPGSRYANPPQPFRRDDTPMVNQMRTTPTWSPMPGPQPPRRSVWPWVIGIGAILGFMGLGVLILVLALAGINSRKRNLNTNSPVANRNTNQWNANVNSGGSPFLDDFSNSEWTTGTYAYGKAWYKDDEYHLQSNKGAYFVMYAPNQKYQTANSVVRVTTRRVAGVAPGAGYGLVIHSERSSETKAVSHYAFLIRNGNNPSYQVLQNREGKQTLIVTWTGSSYLRGGSNTNQLEVISRNGRMTFLVNGHQLTSFTGNPASMRGVAGFYTSDANEVAFDNLEIIR